MALERATPVAPDTADGGSDDELSGLMRRFWLGVVFLVPLFLIAMVPVVALLRAGLFFYYCSTPADSSARAGALRRGRLLKTGAALLLGLSLFLPLYYFGGTADEPLRCYGFSWDLVRDDAYVAIPLAFAFLWPWLALALSRRSAHRHKAIAIQLAEPLLIVASVLVLLWIPQFQWEARTFLFFFLGLESAHPALGTYVAVAANGAWFIVWLWEILRPSTGGGLGRA